MVRRGDVHGIDIVAGEQFAKIIVGGAVLALVTLVHLGLFPIADILADIAHGEVLHIRAAQETAKVRASLVTEADPAHADALAGRDGAVPAQGARRDESGESQDGRGQSGRFNEFTPAGF